MHNILLSKKGSLSGVTTRISVIVQFMKNHKVVAFYSSVPIVLFSSSHDPGTDEPEEGSPQLICPLRMGDLVVYKSSFNFMRRYGYTLRPQRREGASSLHALGKSRPRLSGVQGASKTMDLEIIAGKGGLLNQSRPTCWSQWIG